MVRLVRAECEFYDLSAELQRQRNRLDALLDGDDVTVYRHEIPAEHRPPRDGTILYTLHGDRVSSH